MTGAATKKGEPLDPSSSPHSQVVEGATVKVNFDDSVISDTATEKAMFMSEIAAGVRGRWEYRERFAGEDEATAMQAVSAIDSEGGSGSLADLMAVTGSM